MRMELPCPLRLALLLVTVQEDFLSEFNILRGKVSGSKNGKIRQSPWISGRKCQYFAKQRYESSGKLHGTFI